MTLSRKRDVEGIKLLIPFDNYCFVFFVGGGNVYCVAIATETGFGAVFVFWISNEFLGQCMASLLLLEHPLKEELNLFD